MMKIKALLLSSALLAVLVSAFISHPLGTADEKIISYTVNPQTSPIRFYWKDDKGKPFKSLGNLKAHIAHKGKRLRFAMNGGMYKKDNSPQGLFILNHQEIAPADTGNGYGNFYLKPNGIFYITDDNKAAVCRTEDFPESEKIRFATQSGPMLVINGHIHDTFKKGSANLNIRNGVGILPDGKVLFAISSGEINLYDFASFFKDHHCKNALYLDGFVSRMYLPEKKWEQTDGNFGVIIGIEE